jgi:hypothetical protein
MDNDKLIFGTFKTIAVEDKAATAKFGRPMFKDKEICEVRIAGDRDTIGVFPAHEAWKTMPDANGRPHSVTYAMRFEKQYQAFKQNMAQTHDGTPLEELTFLTVAKRSELKALNIHTAEALAGVDGPQLKQLGVGGRELKDQAQAFLDKANGTVEVAELRKQIEELEKKLAEANEPKNGPKTGDKPSPFADMESDDIKNWIKDATGSKPQGNPSHETLVRMADEINAEKAKEQA